MILNFEYDDESLCKTGHGVGEDVNESLISIDRYFIILYVYEKDTDVPFANGPVHLKCIYSLKHSLLEKDQRLKCVTVTLKRQMTLLLLV